MGKSIYSKFPTWLCLLISEIPVNSNRTCAGRMNEMVLSVVSTSKMPARKLVKFVSISPYSEKFLQPGGASKQLGITLTIIRLCM